MKNSFIVYFTYNMGSKTCNFFYKTFLTKKKKKAYSFHSLLLKHINCVNRKKAEGRRISS